MDVTKPSPSPDLASRVGTGATTSSAQTGAATTASTPQGAATVAAAVGDRVDIQPLDVAAALQILVAEVRAELPLPGVSLPGATANSLPLSQSVALVLLESQATASTSPFPADLPPPATAGPAVPLVQVTDPQGPLPVSAPTDLPTVLLSSAELSSAEAATPGFLSLVGDPGAGANSETAASPSGTLAPDGIPPLPLPTPAAAAPAGVATGLGVSLGTDSFAGLGSRPILVPAAPLPGMEPLPGVERLPGMEPLPGMGLLPRTGPPPGMEPPSGQPLMPRDPDLDVLEPPWMPSSTRLPMPDALTLLSSPAQASPMLMRMFLRAVPEETDNLVMFTQLEATLQSALDRAVSAVEQWRDVPQVVVDAARETRGLVMSQLGDAPASSVWPRPEWLWLTPQLERYRRRRRLARRALTDPDLWPVHEMDELKEEKERPPEDEP